MMVDPEVIQECIEFNAQQEALTHPMRSRLWASFLLRARKAINQALQVGKQLMQGSRVHRASVLGIFAKVFDARLAGGQLVGA